jgi:small subunit ribosomal protein S9
VKEPKREVIPGEHLEPILPEEQPAASDDEFGYAASAYAEAEVAEPEAEVQEEEPEPAPAPREVKELAADARYQATGKRKTSVARVIIKPGTGEYQVNGRALEDFFPRTTLQKAVRAPLETAGYEERMDVIARIHGGGVSAQAGALRHGVARALVEADPNLRGELKRRGFLTRDARAKERKKAGLKKARKRPQFSKR